MWRVISQAESTFKDFYLSSRRSRDICLPKARRGPFRLVDQREPVVHEFMNYRFNLENFILLTKLLSYQHLQWFKIRSFFIPRVVQSSFVMKERGKIVIKPRKAFKKTD